MRTMGNIVAVIAIVGLWMGSSPSAQACYGRRNCSICAARAYAGACTTGCYGYGYGSGYNYGCSPGYGYANSNTYTYYTPYYSHYAYACRPKDESDRKADGAAQPAGSNEAAEKLAKLEGDLRVLEGRVNGMKSEIKSEVKKDIEELKTSIEERRQSMENRLIEEIRKSRTGPAAGPRTGT